MTRRAARLALLAGLLLAACGSDEPPSGGGGTDEVSARVRRERASALFYDGRLDAAAEELAPLLDRPAPLAYDLVAAGNIAQAKDDMEAARTYYERAVAADPADAAARFNLAMVHAHFQDYAAALPAIEKAREVDPDDFPTRLAHAFIVGEAGRSAEARRLFQEVLHLAENQPAEWRLAALARYRSLLQLSGEPELLAAVEDRLADERAALEAAGRRPLDELAVRRGAFGYVDPPADPGTFRPRPAAPAFQPDLGAADFAGYPHLIAATLYDDARRIAGNASSLVGPPDLVAYGPAGLSVALRLDDGGYAVRKVLDAPVERLWLADLNDDGRVDFLLPNETGLTVLLARDDGWSPSGFAVADLSEPPADVAVFDADSDGDLDLVAGGGFGLRVLRNDGAAAPGAAGGEDRGAFVDATREMGVVLEEPVTEIAIEDFDGDADVDLLVRSGDRTRIVRNEKNGRYGAPDLVDGLPEKSSRPAIADFDGDRRPDLLYPGSPARLHRGRPDGRFAPPDDAGELPIDAAAGPVAVVDADLDGAPDAVAARPGGGFSILLAPGGAATSATAGAPAPGGAPAGRAAADLTNDYRLDLAECGPRGTAVLAGTGEAETAIRIALRGTLDNRRAVGAIVEVRAGEVFRRIFWRGEPEVVGLGGRAKADVVRVRWPNGARQAELDVPGGRDLLVVQTARLIGCCPFLYTWNGTTYEFVTDVLGASPIGLPIGPGAMAPWDPDEYIRIRGDQLVPKTDPHGERFYELQLTEELREETFLDLARLHAIDHPSGSEVHPNDRMTMPPFPAHEVHVVGEILPPVRAAASDGRDWTAAVAIEDADFAAPFTPFPEKLHGLAEPWWIEIEFDAAKIPAAGRLRLLATGWFLWTGSSVNMAAARTPGVAFVPPVLQTPDGAGGWRDAGPPVGLPAGKTKTMVLDVTEILDRKDPRLRIATTLHLPWDALRLAVGDDLEHRDTAIPPSSARVWTRGFSAPVRMPGRPELEWFDWDALLPSPPWDPTPGWYTRHGEALPLVTAVDDMYVIFGAGDAVTLRFPADLPDPAPGWTRTYLLYLDGWCKDRDPNTITGESVEPLPFHAMKSYPPGPGERFPDTPEHREWRARWNTRPARLPAAAPPSDPTR